MPDLWSYSFSDLLMFSPRVYFRLIALRNGALWPAQILTIGLGLAMICLAIRMTPRHSRINLSICGAMWIWIAWSFFWKDYATINWAAAYFAPVAALQGALCIGLGIVGTQPHPGQARNASSLFALGILTFAVVGYPLIAPLTGRPWMAADIIGISPDPTAAATAAVLASVESRTRWLLLVIPVFWCAMTGMTLWAMDASEYFVAPLCALIAIITAMRLAHR